MMNCVVRRYKGYKIATLEHKGNIMTTMNN